MIAFSGHKELSKRQLLGLEYLKEHGTISSTEYQTITEVSNRTAIRDLNEMKQKGIIVSIRETGRGLVYKLNPP